MATQLKAIQKFMKYLDTHTLTKKSNETSDAFATRIIDRAVKACSNFDGAQAVINQMLADYQTAGDATTFLKKFCGINLSNTDTGAITGADAGGSKIKTATGVVPNGTFDTSFEGTSFTKRGVTFQLAYQDDKTIPYPSNNYLLKNCKALTAEELHVWQGLYSFWAEESLKLIEESYGYSLTDSDAKFKKIRVFFVDDSSASCYTAKSFSKIYENSNGNYVYLAVNMYYFKHIDPKNLDGKYPYWDDYYLDRLIAHELTHTVMNAKVNSFDLLPAIVVEGLAELTCGIDDSQDINIERAVASKNMLKQLLILQEDYNKVDGINNGDYVAGYLFLRYLAKQSLVRGKNIVSNTANKKVTGTALNDTINNLSNGTLVTIIGGAGNDSIRNSANAKIDGGAGADTLTNTELGDKATLLGGAGNDSIRNSANAKIDGGTGADTLTNTDLGDKATLLGGDGNDYITTYNADSVSIDGGNNNDMIKLLGTGKKITVTGGAGNDTISIAGGTALVKYISGNDSIVGFNANSTLQIGDGTGTYSSATSGSNLLLTVGSYKVTLQGAAKLSTVRIVGKKVSGKNVSNSKSNTSITGTAYSDTIYSTGSKVTISALGGKDSIDNRGANVSINAGAGNDSIYNAGTNVKIVGGADNDSIRNFAATVTVNGGTGNDTIYNGANSSKVTIIGDKGNDNIDNRGANVSINAGADDDTIYNAGTNVKIVGGADNDSIRNFAATVTVNGGTGNDTIYNGADSSKVTIIGDTGNDNIDNRGANVSINAGADDDTIYNAGTKVTILGGAGNDSIDNRGNNVTINGGAGNDSLWGSSTGKNTFIYASGDGKDVIFNFNSNDLLKITGAFSAPTYSSKNNSVAFKVGKGSVTLRDFGSTTLFHVNDTTYQLSGGKLVKK